VRSRQSLPDALPILAAAFLFLGCDKTTSTGVQGDRGGEPSEASPSPLPPRREKIWAEFDANRALVEARTIAEFGPRPAGQEANAKTRQYLIDQLTKLGWQPALQHFTDVAPDDKPVEFYSLAARFSGFPESAKRYVIGSHFDTSISHTYTPTGASSSAAGSAILLELARVLALDPQLAGRVELLLLDGSAPFHQLNSNDGLFGSRFYAQMLRSDKRTDDVQAAIFLQNVGAPSVSLNFPTNSDPRLANEMKSDAQNLGFNIEVTNRPFLTDHVPFALAGIPAIALLEANAPQLNTADDLPERLSPGSLARAGQLVLYFLANQHL
jgi:hypothetical protein